MSASKQAEFSLVRADKELFAVYQTICSGADIEMWFDWDRRLKDTKWTDDCYFLMQNGEKVGGAVITEERIMYPFLIPPFCDKTAFWAYLMTHSRRDAVRGVSQADADILLMFDNKITLTAQVMCRPADVFKARLPDGFAFCRLTGADDLYKVGAVMKSSYQGGICEDINGEASLDETVEDVRRVLDIYAPRNLSHAIMDTATQSMVGVCLAGTGEGYVHHFTEIAELCVLPQYRGRGLARCMIQKILTDAYGVSPFVKLFVYAGNSAEYLYRQMGFTAGPRFVNLERRGKV